MECSSILTKGHRHPPSCHPSTPGLSARPSLALELTHGADHGAAEKERAQKGPVSRAAEPLGLHLQQQLPEILFLAFHNSGKRGPE